jgi:hypothetical protein
MSMEMKTRMNIASCVNVDEVSKSDRGFSIDT